MINKKLSGCITAMITPFDNNLQVDYNGLRSNVKFQIQKEVSGLLPLGTTGESPTINDDEFQKIITTVLEETNGCVPVIVGTGTNSTQKTIEKTKKAEKLGVDAVLIVTPYYNKPTQEGIYRHFKSITESVNIPILIYNIPGRTGTNITTETLIKISKLDNIIGVKEASGNINQMIEVLEKLPEDFIVLSGDDSMTLPLMSVGGKGVISVASNILPDRVLKMVKLANSGKINEASKIHFELMPLFKDLFIETNPIPIKTAMSIVGMPSGNFRLPLCEMNQTNREQLKKTLMLYNELKII
jgi:4-hydroxy-tetrahydrodipicolinate synthase